MNIADMVSEGIMQEMDIGLLDQAIEESVITQPKKKRKRRTKKEMEEARRKEAEEKKEKELNFFSEEANQIAEEVAEELEHYEWEKRASKNHEEFCSWELQKAQINGLEQPDFDFRKYYDKGSVVFLVRYYKSRNTKKLIRMQLRTIYPRTVIGIIDNSYCQTVGYSERDNLFSTRQEAMEMYDSIEAEDEDERATKSKKVTN